MNKELTPLEALEKNLNKFVEILLETKHEKPTAVNIAYLTNILRMAFHNELDIIEKSLKALEIIKELPNEEKQVLLNAVYTYTKNEEKYDLLKEVLL